MSRFLITVAVLLMFGMFGTAVSAQDASPEASPVAAECVAPEVPPGTPSPMEEPPAMASPEATPEGEAAPVEASPALPEGEPASDEQAAMVEAAVQNAAACLNAGEYVSYAALFTPEGLIEECGTANVYDADFCFGGFPPLSNVEVNEVQVLDDGRLSADVTYQAGPMLFHELMILEEQPDGMLLIDTSLTLPVDLPEGATVIDGEMADYEFILSEYSAPAGTVSFNVTNTGEYPHELVIVQLPEGVTVEDVFADPSLEEQIQFVGFTFADVGQEAPPLVVTGLEPGVYTLVCFVDVPEGIPHVMRGMIAEFEVTEAVS